MGTTIGYQTAGVPLSAAAATLRRRCALAKLAFTSRPRKIVGGIAFGARKGLDRETIRQPRSRSANSTRLVRTARPMQAIRESWRRQSARRVPSRLDTKGSSARDGDERCWATPFAAALRSLRRDFRSSVKAVTEATATRPLQDLHVRPARTADLAPCLTLQPTERTADTPPHGASGPALKLSGPAFQPAEQPRLLSDRLCGLNCASCAGGSVSRRPMSRASTSDCCSVGAPGWQGYTAAF